MMLVEFVNLDLKPDLLIDLILNLVVWLEILFFTGFSIRIWFQIAGLDARLDSLRIWLSGCNPDPDPDSNSGFVFGFDSGFDSEFDSGFDSRSNGGFYPGSESVFDSRFNSKFYLRYISGFGNADGTVSNQMRKSDKNSRFLWLSFSNLQKVWDNRV